MANTKKAKDEIEVRFRVAHRGHEVALYNYISSLNPRVRSAVIRRVIVDHYNRSLLDVEHAVSES
jgi:hypothetical protein